jgi:LAO/AO transport system kinase
MLAPVFSTGTEQVAIIKTIASQNNGIAETWQAIDKNLQQRIVSDKKNWLLAEKAYYLIQQKRMKNISKKDLKKQIDLLVQSNGFNLYQFVTNMP